MNYLIRGYTRSHSLLCFVYPQKWLINLWGEKILNGQWVGEKEEEKFILLCPSMMLSCLLSLSHNHRAVWSTNFHYHINAMQPIPHQLNSYHINTTPTTPLTPQHNHSITRPSKKGIVLRGHILPNIFYAELYTKITKKKHRRFDKNFVNCIKNMKKSACLAQFCVPKSKFWADYKKNCADMRPCVCAF